MRVRILFCQQLVWKLYVENINQESRRERERDEQNKHNSFEFDFELWWKRVNQQKIKIALKNSNFINLISKSPYSTPQTTKRNCEWKYIPQCTCFTYKFNGLLSLFLNFICLFLFFHLYSTFYNVPCCSFFLLFAFMTLFIRIFCTVFAFEIIFLLFYLWFPYRNKYRNNALKFYLVSNFTYKRLIHGTLFCKPYNLIMDFDLEYLFGIVIHINTHTHNMKKTHNFPRNETYKS